MCNIPEWVKKWSSNVFAYVGPQGSMILLKERIPITRFIFWSFVVIIGVFYTFLIINVDYSQYSEGRTLYTTNVVLGADIIFPEITVCLNSMHSRDGLRALVSDFDLSQVMWAFYGYGYILDSEVRGFQRAYENSAIFARKIDEINMTKLYEKTPPDITCTYRNRVCEHWEKYMKDNGKKWDAWSLIFTRLGYCYHFKPPDLSWSDENTRKNQLSVTIAFNQSDFVLGWAHSRDDLTIFIGANSSNTSPSPSLADNVKVVKGMNPIIELNQMNTTQLGTNRSPCCMKNMSLDLQMDPICGDSSGEDEYSYNNCMEKCLVRQIMNSCHCSLPWFKHTFQCNKNFLHTAEDCNKIKLFDDMGYCSFTSHVQCVSAFMVNQKSKCSCIPSCTALSYNYKIQYEGIHQHDFRKLKNVQNKNNEIENLHLASFVISMNDDYETRREEKLEYPLLSLVADVGGTAGLVAGMSIATLCGIIDFSATLVWRIVKSVILCLIPAPITRFLANKKLGAKNKKNRSMSVHADLLTSPKDV